MAADAGNVCRSIAKMVLFSQVAANGAIRSGNVDAVVMTKGVTLSR